MTTHEPGPGSIVHLELYSEDADATRAFFEAAFDWRFERPEGMEEMDYHLWRSETPPFGGLAPADSPPFDPPTVLAYLLVDDIDEAVEAVTEAGAEVLVQQGIPGAGAMAMYEAPGGVIGAVWESHEEGVPDDAPEYTDEPAAGSLTHLELYSEDPEATRRFHETAFGWAFESVGDGAYTMARTPTPPAVGLMAATDEFPPGTLAYFEVEAAAAALETIEAAGGSVLREPFDVEGWGTMGVFEAPGGIVGAVWESAPAAADDRASREAAP